MKWQPIETAPTNVPVRLGYWDIWNDRQTWCERDGIAYKRRYWLWRVRADYYEEATHWQPLPEPPCAE